MLEKSPRKDSGCFAMGSGCNGTNTEPRTLLMLLPAERPRGIAFIEFADARDADTAVRRMDRLVICGREVRRR